MNKKENTVSPGMRALAIRSFALIGAQKVLRFFIIAIGGIFMARLLVPEDFGAFAVILFAVSLGVTFGELGLGTALIQRRDRDVTLFLGKAFLIHIIIASSFCAILVVSANFINTLLSFKSDISGPLSWLSIILPISALRMPPAVLLERKLCFFPIVLSDTIDVLVFYSIAGTIAYIGGGVWSFVIGAIVGRFFGLFPLWLSAKWKPSFKGRWDLLFPSIKFGTFLQLNSLVTMFRDSFVPILVAAMLGVKAVGFLNWSSTVALLPLQFVRVAGRILFTTLAQFQNDPERFSKAFNQAFNRVAILVLPISLWLLVGADQIVKILYGDKWIPAIPAIRLFCLTCIFGGTANLCIQSLYSVGKAVLVLRLLLFWAVLVWLVGSTLIYLIGFNGFPIATTVASFIVALLSRRFISPFPVRILRQVQTPFIAGAISSVFLWSALYLYDFDILGLVTISPILIFLYVTILLIIGGKTFRAEIWHDVVTLKKIS